MNESTGIFCVSTLLNHLLPVHVWINWFFFVLVGHLESSFASWANPLEFFTWERNIESSFASWCVNKLGFLREYVIFNPRSPVDVWIKWEFLLEYVISNPRSVVDVWINWIFFAWVRNLESSCASWFGPRLEPGKDNLEYGISLKAFWSNKIQR